MKTLKTLVHVTLLISAMAAAAFAQAADMTDGEVRKIDKDQKTIILKHAEIKNLQMPGMTMMFKTKDAAMLDPFKPGDKVQFAVEKMGGTLVVTEIRPAK